MAQELIFHNYDLSPYTQKLWPVFGYKGLAWSSVEHPLIAPKPDLTALTGGYRGNPVLQIGADVYVDSTLVLEELENRYPEPSLSTKAGRGLALALGPWADRLFDMQLKMIIVLHSAEWPPEMRSDREAVFPHLEFDQLGGELNHVKAQIRALCAMLDAQLADGRAFLMGARPELVDIQTFFVPRGFRPMMPELSELLADFTHLAAWEERVAAFGKGDLMVMEAADAHAIAAAATPDAVPEHDARVDASIQPGMTVDVGAADGDRGVSQGQLVACTAREIIITHSNDSVGDVHVHFPQSNYRLTPV